MIKQNFWKNKKILITGHNGFKGSWMTMILYLLEAKVYGYSLNNRANRKNEKIFKLKNQLTGYTYGDIRNEKKLHAYLKKISPDVVIHMAAQPLVIDSYKDTKFNYETNVNGLINLLLILKKFRKKFFLLVVTSDKCYLNNNKKKLNEYASLGGDDPYSASKACAEIISHSFKKSFNLPIITARAGNVIGGGDWSENRLIPDLMKSTFEKKTFNFRNPHQSRPWQQVIDLNLNYLKLIYLTVNKKIDLSSWNLGPSKSFKNSVIVKYVRKKFGLKIKIKNKNIYKEKHQINLDINRAKKIGIKNNFSIFETLDTTINWYENYYQKKNMTKFSHYQIVKYLND
jgi:CDP-glucose 4,6-dehydratase